MNGPTPEQLLAGATTVTTYPGAGWESLWPRVAAVLTRQALESGIERFWVGPRAGMTSTSTTVQMLCLPTYLADARLARDAYATWSALSNACHAHPYDLSPTAGELRAWIEVVGRVLAATAAMS
jgi:hypothetical protein